MQKYKKTYFISIKKDNPTENRHFVKCKRKKIIEKWKEISYHVIQALVYI